MNVMQGGLRKVENKTEAKGTRSSWLSSSYLYNERVRSGRPYVYHAIRIRIRLLGSSGVLVLA